MAKFSALSRVVLLALCTATFPIGLSHSEPLRAVSSPESLGFDSARLQRVTQSFQGYVDTGQIAGAVLLIARNDKVAYFKAFGFQDREQKVPMSTDSIFRIASMTKPIVSVGAMMLVEEGKLDLLAPVSQYLPELKDVKVAVEKRDANGSVEQTTEPQWRPMTVQDLMRHTAGLVYGQFGDGPIHKAYRAANMTDRNQSLAEFITKLSQVPLAHQPGQVWEYSMATDVLGRVIEVVSGMPLDAYLAERVTKPLGMNSTGFSVSAANAAKAAQPQTEPPNGQRPPMFDMAQQPRFLSGGGGMVSTAEDYFRFCEMMLHNGAWQDRRFLAPSTVALMTSDALPPGIDFAQAARTGFGDIGPTPAMGQGFGLGFAVRKEPGHNPLPGSVGTFYWTGAYGTTFWIDPKEKLIGIAMMQIPIQKTGVFRRITLELIYQALNAGPEAISLSKR